jgi:hypothetical protein
MTSLKQKRYVKAEADWLGRCRYGWCLQKKRKCTVCGHPGHLVVHKFDADSGQKQGEIVFQHSHFLENQDAGRNMFCKTGTFYPLKEAEIEHTWDITKEGKLRMIMKYVADNTT